MSIRFTAHQNPVANDYPNFQQIIGTFNLRRLQNDGKAPTRLLVSLSLAKKLWMDLLRNGRRAPVPEVGQCADLLGMSVRIVYDDSLDGEFEIDYKRIEHNHYTT